MIRIGIVGIGFMGMIHYLAAQSLRGAKVTAIASRDAKKRAGDWTCIRGNFGPPGTLMDLAEVTTHESFDQMCDDPNIDLIDICSPTVQHAAMAIRALRAGKHVFVEKPISLTLADADAMLSEAKNANRRLLVGHVLPFFPEFALVADAVRTLRFGKLLAGIFQRIIARPDWSAAISDAEQTGGPAIDLHIHDTHFVRLICGMPRAVFATGRVEGQAVVHVNAQYLFGDDEPIISCSSGALCQSARPFMHGYELYFERGTLTFQSGVTPPTLFAPSGETERPSLPGSSDPVDCFKAELQTAVDAIDTGSQCSVLEGELARDALALCQLECQSVLSGKLLVVTTA